MHFKLQMKIEIEKNMYFLKLSDVKHVLLSNFKVKRYVTRMTDFLQF